jgi:hypothetical protein
MKRPLKFDVVIKQLNPFVAILRNKNGDKKSHYHKSLLSISILHVFLTDLSS